MAARAKAVRVGENVTVTDNGDRLIIEIDKNHRGGRSSSGKTIRVASTCGNKQVGGITVNAYVKDGSPVLFEQGI